MCSSAGRVTAVAAELIFCLASALQVVRQAVLIFLSRFRTAESYFETVRLLRGFP
jgi:hypothetical protein